MFQNTKQLILKVTRGCNLSCKYCYVFDKPDYVNEEMSDEVFDWTIRRWLSETNRAAGGNDPQPLELIFHGGEPLNIGKKKFARFAKKAFKYAEYYGKNLHLGIQTNSTQLDSDWYEIFYNYNISAGVSFDGLHQTTDLRNGTSEKVYMKLAEMKAFGLDSGPLMVLHKGNSKSLIYTFKMLQQIGINNIKINRGVDTSSDPGTSDYELSAEELLEASKVICNYMFITKGGFQEGTLFNSMEQFLKEKDHGYHILNVSEYDHCYSKYCGGMRNLMEIEPDGTFQFCGRTAKRSSATVGGSVFDKDVLELNIAAQQWEFQSGRLESIEKHRCSECPAQWICDGGCLAFSHQKYGEAQVDSVTCKYFKKLHQYFSENIKEINTLMIDCGRDVKKDNSELKLKPINFKKQ